MPNRILRDWTDSLRFDEMSADAERLFIRLIMKADDYGRFHANPKLVRAACFPLAETLRANTVAAWLTEISDRQLVFCYTVGTGQYLAIVNFGQRLKQSRAKFPPPPGESGEWLALSGDFREVPGSSGKFPSESETETETDISSLSACAREDAGEEKPPPSTNTPTKDTVREAAQRSGIPQDVADMFFDSAESRPLTPDGGWTRHNGQPMAMDRWQHALAAFAASVQRNQRSGGTSARPKTKGQSKYANAF